MHHTAELTAHLGVRLRGMHHTAELAAHLGVRIKNLAGLWWLLKGQSDKIRLLGNTAIMG